MNLQQIINNKFSIVLAMAMIFLALPAIAAAQHNGALHNLSGDNTWMGGIHIAVGDLNSDETARNQIQVSRISLLTGVFDGGVGVVDSGDADAASTIKMLFEVRRNLRLTNDIVIEIPQNNTPEWFQVMNYLRHVAASGRTIPVMEFFVSDGGNPQGLRFQFNNAQIVSVDDGTAASFGGTVGKAKIGDFNLVWR